MAKTLKELVLQRCEERLGAFPEVMLAKNVWLYRDFDGFTCQKSNDPYQSRHIFQASPLAKDDDPDLWIAAKILGIEDGQIPSDELLREAIKQGFIWSGHIKDEREEAWSEWIANVKR